LSEREPYFRLPRPELIAVIVAAVIQALLLGAFLLLLRHLIDDLAGGAQVPRRTFQLLAVAAAISIGYALVRALEFDVAERLGYELVRRLRMTMYSHLQGMAIAQIQHRSRGGLLLRFTGDLSMLRTWISRGLARGLVSAVVLVGGLAAIAYMHVRLALAIAAVLALGAAVLSELGPRLYRITRQVRRRRSVLTSNVDEQIAALGVVQVFGRAGGEWSRLSKQNDRMTASLFRTARLRAIMLGVSTLMGWAAIVAVLFVGTLEVVAGNTTVGVVTAAVVACRQLAGPVRRLALSYDYYERAKVSRAKICDFLRSSSRPLDAADREELRVGAGTVELHDVSVEGAIDGLTAVAPGRHHIAVVGPNGAGKSTLLRVISGLSDPDGGRVLIDGHPLAERTLRSRFRRIGMVSPDLPLMRGTLRRNLTYRRPSASEEELARVVAICGLDEVIQELPDGLDTWIVERGVNLSLGQRQRVALGRALMGNPPLLLLDEPTANLDDPSAAAVRRAIAHHQGTVFWVTHDVEEAAAADEVWFMEVGRLVERVGGQELRDQLWQEERLASPLT
jgi:ATP-binding cassette, subfamily B, bacterial